MNTDHSQKLLQDYRTINKTWTKINEQKRMREKCHYQQWINWTNWTRISFWNGLKQPPIDLPRHTFCKPTQNRVLMTKNQTCMIFKSEACFLTSFYTQWFPQKYSCQWLELLADFQQPLDKYKFSFYIEKPFTR